MPNARTFIDNLLKQGELEAAINGCLLLCKCYSDSQVCTTITILSGSYHALMNERRNGTISQEYLLLERNRINKSMCEMVREMPADWTAEPLAAAGFSATAPAAPVAAPAQRKGFLEKWGLVLGLVASLMGIAGITLREVFFPKKDTLVEQPSGPKPDVAKPAQQPQQSTEAPKTQAEPAGKPTPSQVRKPVAGSTESSGQPSVQAPPSAPQSDSRFRSFGKTVISDGMERGKVGGKMAFRNVQTGKILCCYADAEDFEGGKANVSQDGVTYFFINKKGERVK